MEHKTTTSDLVIGGAVILILSISPFWILATNIDSDGAEIDDERRGSDDRGRASRHRETPGRPERSEEVTL